MDPTKRSNSAGDEEPDENGVTLPRGPRSDPAGAQADPPDLAELSRLSGTDLKPLREGDPRQVGQWTILARLTPGGMAVVFLGADRARPSDLVVVKLLRDDPDPDDPERLAREVRNAGLVADPRFVARVLDFVPGPVPYLVQEFIAGPTLDWVLEASARRPPAERIRTGQAIGIASGLLQAVAAVHETGVVHRDIKPRNVILHSARGPVLIDFGISQHTDDGRLTATGLVVGTPKFMSPEQMQGRGGAKSDVFAWAVIVVMLMTGQHPFDPQDRCSTPQDYSLAMDRLKPDLGGVPMAYRQVLTDALANDPDDRPTAMQLITRMDVIARSPGAGFEANPHATRQDWLARARGLDLGKLFHALLDINSSSAVRSEQDRRELLRVARTPAEKVAVRIHYHRHSTVLARRRVRLLVVAAALVLGLVAGTIIPLGLEVLWFAVT